MAHLIDKDILVAEIEKLIDEIYAGLPFDSLSSEEQTALWYVKSIMSSINNLEVKEVSLEDLKEELDRVVKIYKPDGDFGWGTLYNIAKHFFELGMQQVKKGE